MKHKHKWQFKESYSLAVEAFENKDKLTKSYCPIIIFYDYYNTFCCECGVEKDVKIK